MVCTLQVAAVKLAHDTGSSVQHPILDRVRSCSSYPDDAASFCESLFCPVPEQRLLPHQAQSHPYLKLAVDSMRYDQARRGVHVVSTAEADEEVVFPRGFDSDEAWGIGPVASASSGPGEKVYAPTFHNRSKQLRRSKRHWWQTAKKPDAYAAAEDIGQPEQTGHGSQSKAHMKQGLGWTRIFKPFTKGSKVDKGAEQATEAALGLWAPVNSRVISPEGGGQADVALQHDSKVAVASLSIAVNSSLQQLAAANSQTIVATAAQGDGVPVAVDGVHAAVGHAAVESQLLQPDKCRWQHSDLDATSSLVASTEASLQASQDTTNGHHEQQPNTEQGKTM